MNGNRGSNTGFAVVVAVLTVILVVVIAVYFLLVTGTIRFGVPQTTEQEVSQQNVPVKEDDTEQEVEKSLEPEDESLNDEALQQNLQQEPLAVEKTAEPVQEEVQPTLMYVANVKNSVYFRSAPAENESNIITTIAVGTPITFLSNENAVFAKISYGNKTGYVKRDYLSSSKPTQSVSSGNTTVQKYVYVANVKNSIYLRSSAAENSSNIITTIPVGTKVGYIERINSVFSKIKYSGNIGYAKTAYLEDYYTSSNDTYMTVVNVKNSIYLRSSATENSSNIITTIPVGSTVRFISSGNGTFYKIEWNGYTGYAKSKYLR